MTMADDQGAIFFETEGDRWFARNSDTLTSADRVAQDVPLRMLTTLPSFPPRRVLEIGCANGWRLAAVRERYGHEVIGVEPSAMAIKAGRRRYGMGLDLRRGLSRALPMTEDEKFSIVIVSFVFHWISRDALLASMAEIDRVLQPGGHLVIQDFLPDEPLRRPYHHLAEGMVWTYKQDVAEPFLATQLYHRVARELGEHDAPVGVAGEPVLSENRTACDVLQKIGGASLHSPARGASGEYARTT